MPPWEQLLLAAAIVVAASAVQASIGFGLALVAAPLLALLDRAYVPGPLIGAGLVLGAIMALRERAAIDARGVRSAAVGRLVGVVPAGAALHLASRETFDLLFSLLVLSAVALSLVHRTVRPTPGAVFGAGVASGFMGTITSIGGPPLALLYQNARGPELRATLAAMFVVGSLLSIAVLTAIGRFGAQELLYAATLTPAVLLGVAVSGPLVPLLDRGATRPLVLTLSAGAALALLGRAFA